MPSVMHLIRPEIADLEPYTPIVPLDVLAEQLQLPVEQIVKLDANENPYGPSPQAQAALAHEPYYAIYPDPECRHLRAALSHYTGQPAARIICGTGADELLDLLVRLFLQPDDAVIDCPPTFGMYAFDTAINGGRLIAVPRRADFSLDIPAIEQAAHETGAKLLFLASPNNPTGNQTSSAEFERLLQLPLLVIVDEAYIEFADGGVTSWVGHYENLAVVRTFSKWAGLAGLRLGYAVLPDALAAEVWKIRQPYSVNLAALVAAQASLADLDYLQQNVARILAERNRMYTALRELPLLEVHPSTANFLLCRVVQGTAYDLKTALAREGILVRYYRKPLLQNYIRISIGTPAQNDRLLEMLQRWHT